MNSSERLTHPQQILMEGIGFSDEDLIANRAGQMSKQQREILASDIRKKLLTYGSVSLISLLLAFIFSTDPYPSNRLLSLLFVIPAVASIFLTAYFVSRLKSDLDSCTVSKVSGEVIAFPPKPLRVDFISIAYQMRVKNQIVYTSEAGFLAFERIPYCIVYYVPRSRRILAAEPMQR